MDGKFDFRYTLCFLTRGEDVLMLHRRNPPNLGLWNGVGGRLEPGESPHACALREIWEETGYHLEEVTFRGIMTWEGFETPPGGLYIYTAAAPPGEPGICPEGTLEWKPRAWIFSSPEVVSNILVFGPYALGSGPVQAYHFVYHAGKLISFEIRPFSGGPVVG